MEKSANNTKVTEEVVDIGQFFRPRPQGHSLGLDGSFCKECANARVQKDSPFVFFCGSRRNKRASSFTCNNVFAWKLTINVPVLGEQDRNIMVCLGVSPLVKSSGPKIKITKKTMTIHVIKLFSNSLHFTTHRTRKAGGRPHAGTQFKAKAKPKQKNLVHGGHMRLTEGRGSGYQFNTVIGRRRIRTHIIRFQS